MDVRRNQYQYRKGPYENNVSAGINGAKHQSSLNADVKFDAKSLQILLEEHHMPYLPPCDTVSSRHITSLETSLVDHTEVDNMDEDNKFICTECTSKGMV